jgi:membrane protease YdiL (CAAX protease family)
MNTLKFLIVLDIFVVLVLNVFSFRIFAPDNFILTNAAYLFVLVVALTAYAGTNWRKSGNSKNVSDGVIRLLLFIFFLYGIYCFLSPFITSSETDQLVKRSENIHAISGAVLSLVIWMCFNPVKQE